MKKYSLFFVLFFTFFSIISAQETNGQFRERVYQVDERFKQHWAKITKDGYFESVEFKTYLDDMAKASAYAEFLSEAYDKIAQIFSSFLSRESLNQHRMRSDTLYELSQNVNKWADGLKGTTNYWDPELEEFFSKEEIEKLKSLPWKELFYSDKNTYVYRLKNGWSRL